MHTIGGAQAHADARCFALDRWRAAFGRPDHPPLEAYAVLRLDEPGERRCTGRETCPLGGARIEAALGRHEVAACKVARAAREVERFGLARCRLQSWPRPGRERDGVLLINTPGDVIGRVRLQGAEIVAALRPRQELHALQARLSEQTRGDVELRVRGDVHFSVRRIRPKDVLRWSRARSAGASAQQANGERNQPKLATHATTVKQPPTARQAACDR
jgi:hypothetical protein